MVEQRSSKPHVWVRFLLPLLMKVIYKALTASTFSYLPKKRFSTLKSGTIDKKERKRKNNFTKKQNTINKKHKFKLVKSNEKVLKFKTIPSGQLIRRVINPYLHVSLRIKHRKVTKRQRRLVSYARRLKYRFNLLTSIEKRRRNSRRKIKIIRRRSRRFIRRRIPAFKLFRLERRYDYISKLKRVGRIFKLKKIKTINYRNSSPQKLNIKQTSPSRTNIKHYRTFKYSKRPFKQRIRRHRLYKAKFLLLNQGAGFNNSLKHHYSEVRYRKEGLNVGTKPLIYSPLASHRRGRKLYTTYQHMRHKIYTNSSGSNKFRNTITRLKHSRSTRRMARNINASNFAMSSSNENAYGLDISSSSIQPATFLLENIFSFIQYKHSSQKSWTCYVNSSWLRYLNHISYSTQKSFKSLLDRPDNNLNSTYHLSNPSYQLLWNQLINFQNLIFFKQTLAMDDKNLYIKKQLPVGSETTDSVKVSRTSNYFNLNSNYRKNDFFPSTFQHWLNTLPTTSTKSPILKRAVMLVVRVPGYRLSHLASVNSDNRRRNYMRSIHLAATFNNKTSPLSDQQFIGHSSRTLVTFKKPSIVSVMLSSRQLRSNGKSNFKTKNVIRKKFINRKNKLIQFMPRIIKTLTNLHLSWGVSKGIKVSYRPRNLKVQLVKRIPVYNFIRQITTRSQKRRSRDKRRKLVKRRRSEKYGEFYIGLRWMSKLSKSLPIKYVKANQPVKGSLIQLFKNKRLDRNIKPRHIKKFKLKKYIKKCISKVNYTFTRFKRLSKKRKKVINLSMNDVPDAHNTGGLLRDARPYTRTFHSLKSLVNIKQKFDISHYISSAKLTTNPYHLLLLFNNPILFKTTSIAYRPSEFTSILTKYFVSASNLPLHYTNNNILPHTSFKKYLNRLSKSTSANQMFRECVIPWYYHTLIRFIEHCSGKQALFQFYPFVNQHMDQEFMIRYRRWIPRLNFYERRLGHRFFLEESLHIMHLSFKLRDPKIIASWLKAMILRISFWKTRSIFRFLKYLFHNYYRHVFDELDIKGLKIKLKGKISAAGNSRKRTILYRIGKTSHSTVSLRVVKNSTTINTFTGVMGFQVFLFY